MISKKLQEAINKQINNEFYSEYLYLSMAAYFDAENLDGIAHFFYVQTKEENVHAMKLFRFLIEKGGRVKLHAIDAPKSEFKSVIEPFEMSLKHEQHISKCIDDLMDTAIKENDHGVISFLKWFVDEQVEEEATAEKLLYKVKLVKGEGQGLLMLNNELAGYTPKKTGADEKA